MGYGFHCPPKIQSNERGELGLGIWVKLRNGATTNHPHPDCVRFNTCCNVEASKCVTARKLGTQMDGNENDLPYVLSSILCFFAKELSLHCVSIEVEKALKFYRLRCAFGM